MPFYWQQTDWWCGPAMLQMLLKFYGIFRPQAHLARIAGTTKAEGTGMDEVRHVLKQYGIRYRTRMSGTFADIRRVLDTGRPVAVAYVEPEDDESHYAIVVRLTKRDIVMRDPWHGPRFRMTRKAFLPRWRSENRWMLVPMGRVDA